MFDTRVSTEAVAAALVLSGLFLFSLGLAMLLGVLVADPVFGENAAIAQLA
jgi:hypothetical protein